MNPGPYRWVVVRVQAGQVEVASKFRDYPPARSELWNLRLALHRTNRQRRKPLHVRYELMPWRADGNYQAAA